MQTMHQCITNDHISTITDDIIVIWV